MFFSPLDFYYPYWDPYYYRTQQMRRRTGEPMNFLEGIFSFVFGDGDQNYDLDDRRWSLVGDVIKANRGVVTCEQKLRIAPWCSIGTLQKKVGSFIARVSVSERTCALLGAVPAWLSCFGSAVLHVRRAFEFAMA